MRPEAALEATGPPGAAALAMWVAKYDSNERRRLDWPPGRPCRITNALKTVLTYERRVGPPIEPVRSSPRHTAYLQHAMSSARCALSGSS